MEEQARLCAEMMEAMGEMPMMTMPGMMGGMGMGIGMLSFLVSLVVLLLVVVTVLMFVRLSRRLPSAGTEARMAADLRYARGELTREEYLALRRDLESVG